MTDTPESIAAAKERWEKFDREWNEAERMVREGTGFYPLYPYYAFETFEYPAWLKEQAAKA